MEIGVMLGAGGEQQTLPALVEAAREIEAAGLDSIWMANIFSFDAIGALSVIGAATSRVKLGTAVVPTYPRHPVAMAQQALTAAAASGNRFTLGIGLSHKLVIEDMFGMSYDKPASHMQEYLSLLMPLVRQEAVTAANDSYRINNVQFNAPGAEPVPVVVAALGPRMLKIAGELSDGTNTWMVGPRTMENHIVKGITAGAKSAGRPAPKVVAGVPIGLTMKPDALREQAARDLVIYGQLPSYRAMLDREGAAGPADLALLGDENALRGGIQRYQDAGVTELNAAIVSEDEEGYERTLEFLAGLKG
ncbi:MAG: TIGR03564 family F420-dependent LLM class oxidoreductase [Gammaproteobacteria bacterium]|nr:TIGR03564 family F420-dependent LLM class oxidoreductase [Gammaproteobacteria bacterium]MCY4322220.1 TIGR03564 family F420-dependent LLM class oxidoreductase [Gammaproteobacteria bacterium]